MNRNRNHEQGGIYTEERYAGRCLASEIGWCWTASAKERKSEQLSSDLVTPAALKRRSIDNLVVVVLIYSSTLTSIL
eukprot:scaffold5861_cov98-Skeletonema_dohrnii-CCMP3373.AAC.4